MVRKQEALRDAAVASRMSQTDQKGWKQAMKGIDQSVERALKPPQPERIKTDDRSLASFFGQIGKLPTKRQVQRQINSGKRPSS